MKKESIPVAALKEEEGGDQVVDQKVVEAVLNSNSVSEIMQSANLSKEDKKVQATVAARVIAVRGKDVTPREVARTISQVMLKKTVLVLGREDSISEFQSNINLTIARESLIVSPRSAVRVSSVKTVISGYIDGDGAACFIATITFE